MKKIESLAWLNGYPYGQLYKTLMQHLTSIRLLNVIKIQRWVSGLAVKRQNDALRGNVNRDASPYFFAWMKNCSSSFNKK